MARLGLNADASPMGLRAVTYTLEIVLDPENRQREHCRLRKNNRARVELEIK